MTAALVPELSVTDWRASVRFYTDVLGFTVVYDRPEDGFACLALGSAELMIDQIDRGRTFDATLRSGDRPFGRGINLQIGVSSIQPCMDALAAAGWPLILPLEDRWYRRGDVELGNRQFIVADPDGYLLRLFEDLGQRESRERRPAAP